MSVPLSLAEKRLLAALPLDGSPIQVDALVESGAFAASGEVLRAAGGPERHGLVSIAEETESQLVASAEAKHFVDVGLPERRAVAAIEAAGGSLPMGQLASAANLDGAEVKVAIGWLKRKGWADISQGALSLKDGVPAPGDDETLLAALVAGGAVNGQTESLQTLAQRGGLIQETERTHRFLSLTESGKALAADLDVSADAREVNQITPDLIAKWEEMSPEEKANVQLRPFDFDVAVADRHSAKPHPLTQIMQEIRAIFLEMGFTEISGDYVESAFWNMDALFIPQDHPAREEHDTFYLENPASLPVNADDAARVKEIHETGGDTGSTGWGGTWSPEVAAQGLLRTHTTNTTIRYLAENPDGPHKVFGLGRVFRNETMDSTHLPEFHQIEGIITEPGTSFNTLIGVAREFFTRIGFEDVRFRPAYFPYTEPSMEVDVMYRGKWMELGGSGVFRPEVTEPLGVKHPVIAWGFGLERLAMMRLGLKDIRQLYVSDLSWLKENPLQ